MIGGHVSAFGALIVPVFRGESQMKRTALFGCFVLASASIAAPAHAGELFGGLYVHDVKIRPAAKEKVQDKK